MRYILAIVGVLAVVGGLAGIKFKQISSLIKMGEAMAKSGPPPEAVATATSREEKWQSTVSAVGSVSAAKGVTVTNEVAGIVTAIRFESGTVVKQGQILVELDTSVERAQLASAIARKQLAHVNATRSRALLQEDAIARSQLDNDESALKSSSADVGALQAQIERKTVRAPFSGRLGIRGVNLGQYLNPGTAITVLNSVDGGYIDFTLPQQRLPDVSVGLPVRVSVDGSQATIEGKIAAIDPTVDPTTRMIKLRATVAKADDRLRPGMFVNVSVVFPEVAKRVIVPATAVIHASFGDSVFVVETRKDDKGNAVVGPDGHPARAARQQFVRVGETRGDYVAVLDGVTAGQEVVVAGAFKLRNGSPVAVNNDVKTNPQLAPRPENR
ncbi:MAG TPA: efflux RND transporter periplasmic adaptor subunit [Haliangiales bacterium]|nr:efflux RND transporter periplasmic adaptor subunit [Haliangiales bacterium]